MKAILTPAQDVEQQVDLAVRLENEAHGRGLIFVVKGCFFPGLFAGHKPRDEGAQFVEQLQRHSYERERHGIAGGGDDGGKDDVGHHGIHPQTRKFFVIQNANFHGEVPKSFSRPVNLDNETYQANFQTVTVRSEIFAGGRVYFCEHGTPELIWRPEWQSHSNGAEAIPEIIVVSSMPYNEADDFAKLLNGKNIVGQVIFDGGKITVLSKTQYSERYGTLASSMRNRDSIFGGLIFQTNNRDHLNGMLHNGLDGVETQIEKLRTLVRISAFDALIEFID